jgi:hypothetical protein
MARLAGRSPSAYAVERAGTESDLRRSPEQ